jgi:hypothetical protein
LPCSKDGAACWVGGADIQYSCEAIELVTEGTFGCKWKACAVGDVCVETDFVENYDSCDGARAFQ